MRRALPFLAVAIALVLSATARAAAPPSCQTLSGVLVAPGEARTFDAPCGAGTYTLTPSDPAGGTVTASGTTLTYTADQGSHGNDSFTYTATNGDGTSQPATISLIVNRAPECPDTSASILAGTSLTLNSPCSDPDQDDFATYYQAITPHGSVDYNGPDLIYTPDAGFTGVDTLLYFAVDSFDRESADGTLTITVKAVPAATPTPVATPVKDTTAPAATLTSVPGQKLKQVLAKGLRLTLSSNEAGTATVTVAVDAKTARKLHIKREVGRAGTSVRAGTLGMTVKLAAKARKAFKKLRTVKLSVKAVVTDAAGNPATRSLAVTLKR